MNCKYCSVDCELINHPKMGYICSKCLRQRPKKKSKKLKKHLGYIIIYTDASKLNCYNKKWGIAFYRQDSYKYDSNIQVKTNIITSTSSNQAEYKAILFAFIECCDFIHINFRTDCEYVYNQLTKKYFNPSDPIRKIFDDHPHWVIEEIHSSQNKAHKPSRNIIQHPEEEAACILPPSATLAAEIRAG